MLWSLGKQYQYVRGLAGLNLEIGQDATSSKFADKVLQLLKTSPEGSELKGLDYQAKAVKGLVELLPGNTEFGDRILGTITCYGSLMRKSHSWLFFGATLNIFWTCVLLMQPLPETVALMEDIAVEYVTDLSVLWHLKLDDKANMIHNAIIKTIADGKYRIADLGGSTSTTDFFSNCNLIMG